MAQLILDSVLVNLMVDTDLQLSSFKSTKNPAGNFAETRYITQPTHLPIPHYHYCTGQIYRSQSQDRMKYRIVRAGA